MPLDGVTLGFVASELKSCLVGGRVDRVLQPENDEIHIIIRSQGENHRLLLSAAANAARAHLTQYSKTNPMSPPMLCMLFRKHLVGGRVMDVRRIAGDRILEIDIDNLDEMGENVTRTLVCEFMGRHSNIILCMPDRKIVEAVRHVNETISRVRLIQPGLIYTYPPSQGKLNPDTATATELADRLSQQGGSLGKALSSTISGFSPQAAREIAFRLTGDDSAKIIDLNLPLLSENLHHTLEAMYTWGPPVLLLDADDTPLDVFPYVQHCRTNAHFTQVDGGISAALDAFHAQRDRRARMTQRSQTLTRTLKTHIERCEKKLSIQQDALNNAERMDEYRKNGELIQANLYRLVKGMESAQVEDFYEPECPTITIPMDKRFSPAQNAQKYFKRYQKARSAKELAADQMKKTKEELDYLETQLDDLRKCSCVEELIELREMLVASGHVKALKSRVKQRKTEPSLPFHYRSTDGIDIIVGKNSLQNDRLTADARGNETWLHAKNMPGSHVLILSENVPDTTLAEAAMLAAYYSKGQTSAKVPIDYTLRKYVKKPGSAPAGFVIYTNQKTLYITPDERTVKKITLVRG